MKYTKLHFAEGLKAQLRLGWDVVRIARWAHAIFIENIRDLEPDLKPIIMQIVAMEEGPEFELNAQELEALATKLENSDFGHRP